MGLGQWAEGNWLRGMEGNGQQTAAFCSGIFPCPKESVFRGSVYCFGVGGRRCYAICGGVRMGKPTPG